MYYLFTLWLTWYLAFLKTLFFCDLKSPNTLQHFWALAHGLIMPLQVLSTFSLYNSFNRKTVFLNLIYSVHLKLKTQVMANYSWQKDYHYLKDEPILWVTHNNKKLEY